MKLVWIRHETRFVYTNKRTNEERCRPSHEMSLLVSIAVTSVFGWGGGGGDAFAKLRKTTVSFVMSILPFVRMEQLGWHWTDFHEIWYMSICWRPVEKIQISLKCCQNNGSYTWRSVYIFIIYYRILLRTRMFQTYCREDRNAHFVFSNTFCRKSCRLWDNVGKYCIAGQAADDNIIRHMRIACWVPKATNTHSEYVTLIAFPMQQWMQDRASVLRYTYIAWLVKFIVPLIYAGV
jgi:hypothetical protein